MYEWLAFASVWMALWFLFYIERPLLRREMLWVSAFTALAGLTQPLFVPEFWTPPSLFNLAATSGFDVESILFAFATGGIASVLYESGLKIRHRRMLEGERRERRWLHLFSLAAVPVVFVLLLVLTSLNPIYCLAAAMLTGAVGAVVCRPDLIKNTLLGGVLFTGLYFFFFVFVGTMFPTFIEAWNLAALSGVVVAGVPIEELMFAFTFGMFWSGVYEHVKHYVVR